MTAGTRQEQIIQYMMEQDGTAKIQELAKKFRVSAETVRRDLELLQDRGAIQRICGGAMLMPVRNSEFTEPTTAISGRQNKIAIGQAASSLIEDGQKLFISSGYTCLEVAKALKKHKDLTIVTNSYLVAQALLDTNFEIIVLGGKLERNELYTSGPEGIQTLQGLVADWAIIGTGGFSFKFGLSDYNTLDDNVRTSMMNHCNRLMLVAESNKFGKNAFKIRYPATCGIDTIVSDIDMPEEYISGLREMGIELILAKQ